MRSSAGEQHDGEGSAPRPYAMVVVVECVEPREGWEHVADALSGAGGEAGVSTAYVGEPLAAPEAREFRTGSVWLFADETPVELRGEWS
jgi:hypothetical protein